MSGYFSTDDLGSIEAEWREKCRADEIASRGDEPKSQGLIRALSESLATTPIERFQEIELSAVDLLTGVVSAPEAMRQLSLLGEVVARRLDSTEVLVELQRCCGRAAETVAGNLVRRAEDEAKIDVLTGLGGRGAYNLDIHGAFRRIVTGQGSVVLVNMDLNGLRIVNNEISHNAGDTYLRFFAVLLTTVISGYDARAYHVSGDEFYALFRDMESDAVNPILVQFRAQDDCPPMSFGLAECPKDAMERAEFEVVADQRMKEMKFAEEEGTRFERTRRWLASEHWVAAQQSM